MRGRVRFGAAVWAPDIWAPGLSGARTLFSIRFSLVTLFRLVARLARVRVEDSSRNRFALIGIQRDFFGGIFPGGIFVGGILSGYRV